MERWVNAEAEEVEEEDSKNEKKTLWFLCARRVAFKELRRVNASLAAWHTSPTFLRRGDGQDHGAQLNVTPPPCGLFAVRSALLFRKSR